MKRSRAPNHFVAYWVVSTKYRSILYTEYTWTIFPYFLLRTRKVGVQAFGGRASAHSGERLREVEDIRSVGLPRIDKNHPGKAKLP